MPHLLPTAAHDLVVLELDLRLVIRTGVCYICKVLVRILRVISVDIRSSMINRQYDIILHH